MDDIVVHDAGETRGADVRWWQRREVKAVFWIWLVLTIVGLSLSWVPAWLMGASVSTQMDDIKQTMTLFTALAAPVGALIWAIMIYSLVRWHYTGDEPPPDDAPGFTTNAPVVIGWILVSAILTLLVFVWGLLKIASIPSAGGLDPMSINTPAAMEIEVTGNQWVWNFTYPEYDGIQSDILYLPIDREVEFSVTSNDVIHSFWIVEMGVKVDANPGAVTHAEVTPNTVGTYEVRCAELCGILHAAMQTQAKVLSAADFEAWVKSEQGAPVIMPAVADAEGGG